MLLWTSGGVVDFSTPEIDALLEKYESIAKMTREEFRAQYEQQWTPEMVAAAAPKKPLSPDLEEKLARFSKRMKG